MGQIDDLTVLRRELDDHRELLRTQAALLDQQAAVIDELRVRLGQLETGESALAHPGPTSAATGELVTDRRNLLRHAGGAAAGAVAGASVLAQAAPAAAAAGNFDGNPAVNATANPTTGVGVQALAAGAGGKGVVSQSTATTGGGIGIEGTTASTLGIGVRGEATTTSTNGTERSIGVAGIARSPVGTGISGRASATTGQAIGVEAVSSSAAGQALNAFCSSTTGTTRAVRAACNSTGAIVTESVANAATGNTISVRALTISPTGTAVSAEGGLRGVNATGATGVAATGSVRGVAASATGDGTALDIGRARAAIFFSAPQPPPLTEPSPREHSVHEVVYDTNADLWLCVGSGVPGDFVRLGGGSTVGALELLDTPKRVYDSRPGEQPLNSTKGPISGGASGATRVVDMTNNTSGVPTTARAALVTLTIVNTSASGGFLALFRNGAPTPTSSSINWFAANQVIATTTVTALDLTAKAAVFCPPNSSTNFFVDVIGFYQ
jgi:hypothetical protein